MGNILESFAGTAADAAGVGDIYDGVEFLLKLCDEVCQEKRKADPEQAWKDM